MDKTQSSSAAVKRSGLSSPTSGTLPLLKFSRVLAAMMTMIIALPLWLGPGLAQAAPPVPYLVKDINTDTSDSSPAYLIDMNGTLFFSADDGSNGAELWKSDGTETGTVIVKDINPGSGSSAPHSLTSPNGTLFFSADDGSNGRELWKSDGTEAGTVMVKDINPGGSSSFPAYLVAVNDTLFFSADDGTTGVELWALSTSGSGFDFPIYLPVVVRDYP